MGLRLFLYSLIFAALGCHTLAAQSGHPLPPTLTASATSSPAVRGDNATGNPAASPDVAVSRLEDAMRQRDAIIRNLLERVQELETRLNGGTSTARGSIGTLRDETFRPEAKVADATKTKDMGAPVVASEASMSSTTTVVKNSGYDEDERRASQALDQALVMRGGLLLPSGTLEVDNTVSYFSAASDHVTINGFALLPVLVVGDITSQRARRDILLPTFTMRLGLPHKWQGDLQIPYGYQLSRTVSADNTSTTTSGFGLGDIQGSISRQVALEHGKVPDLLANVRFKGRTGVDAFQVGTSSDTALGSGFYGIQGNLTAVKTSDPVVFFGNLSYTENLPAKHIVSANDPNNPSATIVGHYRPGAAVGFQLGSVLAINPETSMTWGWDQRFTQVTKLNGAEVPASYLVEGTLRMGVSYLFAKGRTLDFGFGVGLTPDTPNLQFSFGLPVRTALWNRHPGGRVR